MHNYGEEFEYQFPGEVAPEVMGLIFNHIEDEVSRIRFGAVCRSWRWITQHCHEFELQFPFDHNVMEQIFNHLRCLVSRIRFGAVCRSWRWVAQRCRKAHQFPWLMLSTDPDSNIRKFFSASDGEIHSIHLPDARGLQCCGSSYGWLVMQKCNLNMIIVEVFLINPLSKAIIQLPNTTTILSSQINLRMAEINMAILSSSPKSSNCLIAAIDVCGTLHFCRLGDGSWTEDEPYYRGVEILFYKQTLYVIEREGNLHVYELDPRLKQYKARRHCFPLPTLDANSYSWYDVEIEGIDYYNYRYLVECKEELLQVLKVAKIDNNSGQRLSTVGFHVHKSDSKGRNWVKVKSLGDGMVFQSYDCAKYFSIRDFPELNLKGNCIYFKDFEGPWAYPNAMGAFYLDNRRIEFFKGDLYCPNNYSACTWFTPHSLHY